MTDCTKNKYILNNIKYNPETGEFIWINSPTPRIKAGSMAGTIASTGYRRIKILNQNIMGGRLAWFCFYGEWPDKQIDHIDGDRTNDRISNLRVVTSLENNRNKKRAKNNRSGCTGVVWNKHAKAWRAQIYIKSELELLGYFKEWFDAVCARKAAEYKHKFHINHGRIT